MLNYYVILGIAADCSAAEIRAAYLRLIKQFHPDIYKGADSAAKTRAVNEAYACLKDAGRRADYDEKLAAFRAAQAAENQPTEAEVLARLEREFRSKLRFWQQQIAARLAQLSKGSQAELKRLFIANKKVDEADYKKVSSKTMAQMQSYKAAKIAMAGDYYKAAAQPEFAAQTLLKIQSLDTKAAEVLGKFYQEVATRAEKEFYDLFTQLNPDSFEKERQKEQFEAQKIVQIEGDIWGWVAAAVVLAIAIATFCLPILSAAVATAVVLAIAIAVMMGKLAHLW